MLVDLATELWSPRLENQPPYDRSAVEDRSSTVEPTPALRVARNASVLEELSTRVLLFNDMVHTFDEVIGQVSKALGCARHRAAAVAWEVHTRGQALVFEGEIFECLEVSSILEEIALHTQVLT